MIGAKRISTLMLFRNKLSLCQGEPFEDRSPYKSTIGALQYLTMTKPDISFVVNFYTLQQLIIGRPARELSDIFMA